MEKIIAFAWNNLTDVTPHTFKCGYCSRDVGSNKGFSGMDHTRAIQPHIYVCPICYQPTYFRSDLNLQIPGNPFGDPVDHLSKHVATVYEEARRCMAVNAYTAATMLCRKLLMNIAVEKGAKEGDSFASYVDYLKNNGFVPQGVESWVKEVKEKGNVANHEVAPVDKSESEDIINFLEMLLKFIYEFPGKRNVPATSS